MGFTYYSRELCDLEPGRWVVGYSEFAAKAAPFLLVEMYDSYRL